MGPVPLIAADAETAPRPLASALHAMKRGDWDRAGALALREGPAAVSLIEWHRLRAGMGSFADVKAFLADHSHWPGLKLLRKRSEASMAGAQRDEIIAFFREEAPQTGKGVLLFAESLLEAGEQGEAHAEVVLAWRSFDLSERDHHSFAERYRKILKPHHEARLDMALWRGLKRDAELMLPLVDEDHRKLAAARQALRGRAGNPDALIGAVPDKLKDDPGLAYERFLWRLSKGHVGNAIQLLNQRSQADTLGEPTRWAGWRRNLARRMMRDDEAKLAYRIATNHGLVEGSSYSDLEWLAGYLSLRKLNDPATALAHFENFKEAVFTPISLGRAGYWIGEAHTALGDKDAAQAAYAEGANYQTSFYGLLATEKAGIGADVALKGAEYFPAWQEAEFAGSDLAQVAALSLAMDDLNTAERFILQIAETQDRKGVGQLANMVEDWGAPHLGVMLGKAAARRTIVIPAPYYPLHPMTDMDLPVPMEMALAIARRESEFDPHVVSGAGAQGLMQVMPATARQVAQGLKLDHDPAAVLNDWEYNAVLGSAYLATLSKQFEGNVIMVSAGYNAGPGRPVRWMKEYGNPLKGQIDIVDWIEHIPFDETRNYVMRVSESLPVYRARLGKEALPVPFSEELVGSSILPLTPKSE
ncbi:lytic transglycosylase domain-containing protein [Alisedimentitalea sp. MJ-SS2]|uniref:lytic transglycosylase domain-containing protein n=1 Tax=Aliisedimentitalea sp. MJ-SS2 TaxID=3049795 RepID=UPI002912A06D|nr:lytic transglycosylase domain-containing protein [Alisedimentitalea sp. MJ-SS2]MDU8927731.1 lytic transglycosylase domain-containing protein [Alisedimentitalea sp. MJ-SS2]